MVIAEKDTKEWADYGITNQLLVCTQFTGEQ